MADGPTISRDCDRRGHISAAIGAHTGPVNGQGRLDMTSKLDRTVMNRAARAYAESEASDPWAYARAMTHLGNGIAQWANADGEGAFYSAEEVSETRVLPDGVEYQARVWRNRFRP